MTYWVYENWVAEKRPFFMRLNAGIAGMGWAATKIHWEIEMDNGMVLFNRLHLL